MDIHRIDGIKFNFDRLSSDELENIHGNLINQHRQIVDEISVVEGALYSRCHASQRGYEQSIGRAVLDGEMTAGEALDALAVYEDSTDTE